MPLVERQGGFLGGINTAAFGDGNSTSWLLQPGEMPSCINAEITSNGSIEKRRGTQRVHVAAIGGGASVKRGIEWYDGDVLVNNIILQVAISNGRAYTGEYSTSMTWTARGGAADFDATVTPDLVPFRDATENVLYIFDGGPLNKINSAFAVTLNIAGTPNVLRGCVYNLRLWGSGDTANPNRLYWSDLGNGDTLGNTGSGGGFADIRTFAKQRITAIIPLAASLLIFHDTGISRFTGWSQEDFDVDSGTSGISNDVGTINPQSIVVVENIAYFVTTRGLYAASESGVQQVAKKLKAGTNFFISTPMFAGHLAETKEILFLTPANGGVRYNYLTDNAVNITLGWTVNCLWPATNAITSPRPLLLGGGNDGFVRNMRILSGGNRLDDILSDNSGGSTFSFSVGLRRIFFNQPTTIKRFRFVYLFCDTVPPSTANFNFKRENEASVPYSLTGLGTIFPPYRIAINHVGYAGEGTLTDVSSSQFNIAEVEYRAESLNRDL